MVAVTPYVSEREHVLVQTRAHTAVLAGAFVLAALSVALLAAAARTFDGGDPGLVGTLALGASAGLVALSLARLAVRVWEWDRTNARSTPEERARPAGALRAPGGGRARRSAARRGPGAARTPGGCAGRRSRA